MSNQTSYCGNFRMWMQIKDPLTELEARERFDNRGRFAVVLGAPEHPRCFLEVMLDKNFINVCVLDNRARIATDAGFAPSVQCPPKWFLSQATFRTFDEVTDRPCDAMTCAYGPDGEIDVRFDGPEPMDLKIGHTTGDVSDHWENPPVFGEWVRFARPDRRIARPPMPSDFRNAEQIAEDLRQAEKQMRPILRRSGIGERHGRHKRT